MLLALLESVESDVQQAGDQLEFGIGFSVHAGTRIGGDRFCRIVAGPAVGIDAMAQGWGKTLLGLAPRSGRGPGFALDDQTEDALAAPKLLVRQYLFVDPVRNGRLRRADDDQALGLDKSLGYLAIEVMRAGQLFAVAKNGCQPMRDLAESGFQTNQPTRNPIGFQSLVQPDRPSLVAMAVTDEGAIASLGYRCGISCHGRQVLDSAHKCGNRSACDWGSNAVKRRPRVLHKM